MIVFKCKMCGGDLNVVEGATTCECEYCGSVQTLPKISTDARANLFNRANHFRRQNDFDRAIAAYEKILDQDDADAEAYWGAVLSRYGIEYVEDPVSHERIPTCHRVQPTSILTDADYLAALQNAPDAASRELYEREARRIAEIQKDILAISAKEKPYDVFICYKDTTDSGSRTKDSTLAQDIYYQLTNEGYKVFFSRITLEEKLGQEYEPYIFAALNSAKVMLVIGTKPEYFNAVWVKNEWSRFLDLMRKDRSKLLIPCYRDMDPYDLPEELSTLQSQDMSKIGFMQDIIHGVKKVLGGDRKEAMAESSAAAPGISSLHKRAVLFLEDGDWASANEYFDRILDIDPEYAPAYIGKVQAALQVRKEEALARCAQPLLGNADYQKAVRFASEQQKAIYQGYNRAIEERLDRERKEAVYREADALEKRAAVEKDFLAAAAKYDAAGDIRDAKERAANCRVKATAAKEEAERQAEVYRVQMEKERKERQQKEEAERIAAQKRQEEERKRREREERLRRKEQERRKKRNRKIALVAVVVLVLAAGAFSVNRFVIQPGRQYSAAQGLLDAGNYDEAVEAFTAMNGYRNSEEKVKEAYYTKASALLSEGKLSNAKENFLLAEDYSDAAAQAQHIDDYSAAEAFYDDGDYLSARPLYAALEDYLDAPAKLDTINEALYVSAGEMMASGDISGAYAAYSQISDYADSAEIMAGVDADYQAALDLWEGGDKAGAEQALVALSGWSDASAKLDELREEMADDAAASGNYDTALTYYGKLANPSEEVSGKITAATQAKAYDEATAAFASGDLDTAHAKFTAAGTHADAAEQAAKLDNYFAANTAMEEGDYASARTAYIELGDYLDSAAKLEACNAALYDSAASKMESGDTAGAYEVYTLISGYSDSADIAAKIDADYAAAEKLLENADYDAAAAAFAALNNYSDSQTQACECLYRKAGALSAAGDYAEAAATYDGLGSYLDSAALAQAAHYSNAGALAEAGDLQAAAEEYKALGDYSNSAEQLVKISTAIADAAMAQKDYPSALTAYLRLEQTDEIKAKEYELAQVCYDEGHFAEATSAYEALGQYELSASRLPVARYSWANQLFNDGSYAEAAEQFALLGDMTDSAQRAQESTYQLANGQLASGEYDTAKATFQSIAGYSDADSLAQECDYRKADAMLASGSYAQAQGIFEELGNYSDSATKAAECVYEQAEILYADEDYEGARALYASISYSDSADKAKLCVYTQAQAAFDAADYTSARELFASIDYEDSADKAKLSQYNEADALYAAGSYADAEALFAGLTEYSDSADRAMDSHLQQGIVHMQTGEYADALTFFETVDYGDSATLAAQCHCELGRAALTSGDMDTAMSQYALATELPEAQEALMSAAKDYVTINETDKAIQMLWLVRESTDALNMLKEIGDQKAQSGDATTAILAYATMDDASLPELQDFATSEHFTQFDELLASCDLLPEELRFADNERYVFATVALAKEQYDAATAAFQAAGDFKDSSIMLQESQYRAGVSLLNEGSYREAYMVLAQVKSYKDAPDHMHYAWKNTWGKTTRPRAIDAAGEHIIGLKTDGTVVAFGENDKGQCDVGDWKGIISIATGYNHTVGLKRDGTVVAIGANDDGQCNIRNWTDIVAIDAGSFHTVGLKADGTVVATGSDNSGQCNVGNWTNIVAIAAGMDHTIGLKADGTVIATDYQGVYNQGQCNVGWWTDIIAIAAGDYRSVGLKSDGTIVAEGLSADDQNDVGNWRDIIEIAAGEFCTIGLRADGTVVATNGGRYNEGQCDVEKWRSIIAIAAANELTVGLKNDGTIITAGCGDYYEYPYESGFELMYGELDWENIGFPWENDNPENEKSNAKPALEVDYDEISVGSKGNAVSKLQQALIDQGYLSGAADGDFGNKTAEAVKKAQVAFGMEQTGVADDAFQKKLYGK